MGYLTITLRARVFYAQLVNEAQPSWLSLVENEFFEQESQWVLIQGTRHVFLQSENVFELGSAKNDFTVIE